jgi:hypothetical protein
MRNAMMGLLLVAASPALADAVVCDPLRPPDSRCYRVEDLARLVIPAGHCVSIVEVDGKPANRTHCNRARTASPDGAGLALPATPARSGSAVREPGALSR